MSRFRKWITGIALTIASTLLLAAFLQITPAQAQEPIPLSENNNCVVCHKNLYILHDTGNYFCLCESPMTCVTCHGGNPTAVTKEAAHVFRDPHPVVGNDTSRCQTCHLDECTDRAAIFDQKAGISNVLVIPTFDVPAAAQSATADTSPELAKGVNFWSVIPVLVLILGSISLGLWINRDYHPA